MPQSKVFVMHSLFKTFLSFLVLTLFGLTAWGQQKTLEINADSLVEGFVLKPFIESKTLDNKAPINLDAVIRSSFNSYSDELPNISKGNALWLRWKIKNVSAKEQLELVITFESFKIDRLYVLTESGKLQKTWEWYANKTKQYTFEIYEIPIEIAPGQTITFYSKTTENSFFSKLNPTIFSQKKFTELKTNNNFISIKLYSFLIGIIGVLLVMGLAAAVQYIVGRDITYGFWAIYLLTNAFFFFAETNRLFNLHLIPIERIGQTPLPWTIPTQFLVQSAYILFINSFLEIRKIQPAIFKFSKITIFITLGGFVFAFLAVWKYENWGMAPYADVFLLFTNLLIFILIIKILKLDIPQKKLILIGSLGVLFTATISAIFEGFEIQNNGYFILIPIVFFGLGTIFELILFSMALSNRMRLIQLENQQLQKNYTTKLETDLADRVSVIQIQNKLLEEQRIINITSEFEQKIAETEITALRSQMNPHFIFNCLNSIKLYSLENDSKAASEYLTKFSRLIRMVLENSRSEKVTLENELETLTLYIEMEAMRFKDKVKYQIKVDKEIDTQFIEIPPLLIQPFVENAIWHGLMQKPEGGNVKIEISQPDENTLHVEIVDDGIGREKAEEYKSKSAMKNKSFGMKVTSERIDLINQMYKTNTQVKILDLKNSESQACGTKVIIEIPF